MPKGGLSKMRTTNTVIKEVPVNNLNNEAMVYQKRSPMVLVARIVWALTMILVSLLVLRFVFILLGANPGNGFVNFIYTISYPFARPFFNIFSYQLHYGISRVEVASLVAIAIYSITAELITRLLTVNHRSTTTY